MSKAHQYSIKPSGLQPGHRKTSSMVTGPASSQNDNDYHQMAKWANDIRLQKEKQPAQAMARDYVPQKAKCEQGCKHLELISYKVHKDQFKSLLVPSRRSGVFSKAKNEEKPNHKRGRKPSVHSDR